MNKFEKRFEIRIIDTDNDIESLTHYANKVDAEEQYDRLASICRDSVEVQLNDLDDGVTLATTLVVEDEGQPLPLTEAIRLLYSKWDQRRYMTASDMETYCGAEEGSTIFETDEWQVIVNPSETGASFVSLIGDDAEYFLALECVS